MKLWRYGLIGVVLAIAVVVLWRYWPRHQPLSRQAANLTPTPLVSCGVPALESISPDVTLTIDSEWQPQQIQSGQTVKWLNGLDHEVVLESKPQQHGQPCGNFGSIHLQPGQSYQLTFLRPGQWFFGLAPDQVGAMVEVEE